MINRLLRLILVLLFVSLPSVNGIRAEAYDTDGHEDSSCEDFALSEGEVQKEEEQEEDEEKLNVEITKVRARISPRFEFQLPGGHISEHFVEHFNNLEIRFNLGYAIIDNSLKSDLTFAYLLNGFTPFVTFSGGIDFENYIAPRIEEERLVLTPTERFISRERKIETGIKYTPFQHFSVNPSFIVLDTFKGSLSESLVLDDGVDLISRMRFVYDSVLSLEPGETGDYRGVYFDSVFDLRHRTNFRSPVSIENRNVLQFYFHLFRTWSIEEKLELSYPIKIWDSELAGVYTLGGFDSIRGYALDSINALRFFLLTTNAEHEIFKEKKLPIRLFKKKIRFHRFRVLFLFDTLFCQEELSFYSRVKPYASTGGGFSLDLSGKKESFLTIRLYAAQRLEKEFAPIVYFKTSLF